MSIRASKLGVLRSARASALLFVLCGASVAAVVPTLVPLPPGASVAGVLVVALSAILTGATIWWLPWHRWGLRSTLWVVPLALAHVVAFNIAARHPYLYSIFYLVVSVWIGVAQPRFTSLWLSPLLALSCLLPFWVVPEGTGEAWRSLLVTLPVCIAISEVVAWLSEGRRRAEVERRRLEARYASLVRKSKELALICDEGARILFANAAVERVLGLSAEAIQGRWGGHWVHPDDRTVATDVFLGATGSDAAPEPREFRAVRADGEEVRLEVVVTDLRSDFAVGGYLVNARDITARHRAAEAVRRSEARFRALLENSSDMVSIIDGEGSLLFHYPPDVLGYQEGENLGRSIGDFVHPDDFEGVQSALCLALARPSARGSVTCRIRDAAGAWRWFEGAVRNRMEEEAIGGIVVNSRDVTERLLAERRLEHLALHDDLTGLPNRAALHRKLRAMIHAEGEVGSSAVLFMDLDRFRQINDTHGHAEGDRILAELSRRLRRIVRPPHALGRLGGDEFIVLCRSKGGGETAIGLGEKVLDALGESFDCAGRRHHLSASLGIRYLEAADLRSSARGPDDLLRDADAAMYAAKRSGRRRLRVFDEALRSELLDRYEIEEELREACARDEIEVHFQPVLDLASGMVVGAEALLRWRHPTRGLLLPGHFLDVAEDSGLIAQFGRRVIRDACAVAAGWKRRYGGRDFLMSVNASPYELAEGEVAATVVEALGAAGLGAGSLCVEVTERGLGRESDRLIETLRVLRRTGVRIAIDDFGTGYSSISSLQDLPVDWLKIDRSFVRSLRDAADPGARAIVRLILDLADRLGLEVVAEGVEFPIQKKTLSKMGCRRAQGFLFGRPSPAEELLRDRAAAV